MDAEESEKYLKEAKTQSALAKIITTGFKALQLQYFFTAGKDEVKAWTILAAGKYKQEGKNYVVNDGDIIFFKFNAGAGLTDKKKVK